MTRSQWAISACLGVISLGLIGAILVLALYQSSPGQRVTSGLPDFETASPTTLISPSPGVPPSATITDQPEIPVPSPPPLQSPLSQAASANALSDPTCILTSTGGLGSEVYTIVQAMPGPNTNGMRIPTEEQMSAWELLVQQVALGDAKAACQIIQSQGFPYHLVHFTDVRNEKENYWILREDAPVSAGWGTYVFRIAEDIQSSMGKPPLIIEVPHPVADWRTDPEGVMIFRQSKARALLIAGTHRCANSDFSDCVGQTWSCGPLEAFRVSDAAHTEQSMFQAAHRALAPCDGRVIVLQLHANSLAGCPDLFISNGTRFPGVRSRALYQAAISTCSDLSVDIADGLGLYGIEECEFTSGASAQAVYSNTCAGGLPANTCTDPPSRPPEVEQFISMEQSAILMNDYQCLVEAINKTWGNTP